MSNIGVIGLGKLGLCWALLLADKGYTVTGIDTNASCVEKLKSGQAFNDEPGSKELLNKYLDSSLRLYSCYSGLKGCDLDSIFIVVPTPSDEHSRFKTDYFRSAVRSLADYFRSLSSQLHIVLVSTTMPGDSRKAFQESLEPDAFHKYTKDLITFSYNPEFIALGSVLKDMESPDFILIGSDSHSAKLYLENLYKSIHGNKLPPIRAMTIESAEITKLAINTYLTIKISYANTIGMIADGIPNTDKKSICEAIGSDSRIGNKYIMPGMGFGGPCLPRDTRAFANLCSTVGIPSTLPDAANKTNRDLLSYQRFSIDQSCSNKPNCKILFIGITYKSGSWLLEDSQQLELVSYFAQRNTRDAIRLYDDKAEIILNNAPEATLKPWLVNILESDLYCCINNFKPDLIVLLNKPDSGTTQLLAEYLNSHPSITLYDLTSLDRDSRVSDIDNYDGSSISRTRDCLASRATIPYSLFSELRGWYEKVLGIQLERIHTKDFRSPSLFSNASDQKTWAHERIHNAYDSEMGFRNIYEKVIKSVLTSVHSDRELNPTILVQSFPTFRLQLPNNISVFEFHKDSSYNHPLEEYNHFIALTDAYESATLWREESNINTNIFSPSYKPIELRASEYICFDTSNFWHGDLPNLSCDTRVSIDFRVLFDEIPLSGNKTLSGKKSIAEGSYYSRFDTSLYQFV